MREENERINNQPTAFDSPELLTVREAYVRLRISKWKLYDLIRSRLLNSIRIGRRRFIPTDAVRSYIQGLQQRESFA